MDAVQCKLGTGQYFIGNVFFFFFFFFVFLFFFLFFFCFFFFLFFFNPGKNGRMTDYHRKDEIEGLGNIATIQAGKKSK